MIIIDLPVEYNNFDSHLKYYYHLFQIILALADNKFINGLFLRRCKVSKIAQDKYFLKFHLNLSWTEFKHWISMWAIFGF